MKITDFGVAVVEEDTHLSKWIVEQRRLDIQADFCRLFAKYIPAGGVVADVGACLGDHTLSYSEMVGSKGRVHAFEPNPVAFECLAFNMLKRHNVVCYRLALGREECAGSILNPQELNLGATIIIPTPNLPTLLKIVPLDLVAKEWGRLDFLKIDAEGAEPDIIQGALATIARLKPVILVEINLSILHSLGKTRLNISDPLQKLGYTLQPAEPHHSFAMETLDVLCLPPKP